MGKRAKKNDTYKLLAKEVTKQADAVLANIDASIKQISEQKDHPRMQQLTSQRDAMQEMRNQVDKNARSMDSNLGFRNQFKKTASNIKLSKVPGALVKHPILTIKTLASVALNNHKSANSFDEAKHKCKISIKNLIKEIQSTNNTLKQIFQINNREQIKIDSPKENSDNERLPLGQSDMDDNEEYALPAFHEDKTEDLTISELDELSAFDANYGTMYADLQNTEPLSDAQAVNFSDAPVNTLSKANEAEVELKSDDYQTPTLSR